MTKRSTMTQYFLLGVEPLGGAPAAAYVVVDQEFRAWAQEAFKRLQELKKWDENVQTIIAATDAFVFLHDLGLLDPEEEEMLQEGNVQLTARLNDVNAVMINKASPYGQVLIRDRGLLFLSGMATTSTLTWAEIGIETDNIRCRYHDCVEAHPVAGENELVSCPTCRASMGLEG